MRTSTIYTIGTALSRAQNSDVGVDVLVAGQWLHGLVTAVDGHGVVLHGDDDVLSVLRMESIDAVQVRQAADFENLPEVEAPLPEPTVHPMPAARGDRSWDHPDAAWGSPAAPTYDEPSTTYDAGPVVVPAPRARRGSGRPVQRPTVGPIVAPFALPDAGLHTMLRSCRQAVVAEQAPAF